MRKLGTLLFISGTIAFLATSFEPVACGDQYITRYQEKVNNFVHRQQTLVQCIQKSDPHCGKGRAEIIRQIGAARGQMKGLDFWLRYLEPIAYKKINGPLPVEWETEVFEKFERPYKRLGAGLTLAELYLDEPVIERDTLLHLIQSSLDAIKTFQADSITDNLKTYPHFFLCNRLFLLNLATIYTTGFECPDTAAIIPELRAMLAEVKGIYGVYNESFPDTPLPDDYLNLYNQAIDFVQHQPDHYSQFDHFTFIKNYVNPLFALNQNLIRKYEVLSPSFVDYTLNNAATTIFSKDLYYGQNTKGIFLRVTDPKALAELDRIGKLLYYDPILSGNNARSCNSCHQSLAYFTDTTTATSLQFNHQDFLPRNTPSLLNVEFNHLLMLDGKHISLQNQAQEVIGNHLEMNSDQAELLKKILSCKEYEKAFTALLAYTPQEKAITFQHITSTVIFYYSKFSQYAAPFDDAMNQDKPLEPAAARGFNLFMSKAQCGTCHFVPQFNGVKPPYVGSEFEVLGVPADKNYTALSVDKGRFEVNPAPEMLHAFRTGSVRNAAYTKPYMHNGVFTSLEEVIDFYDGGGGAGRGLPVDNQTLSADSLHLTVAEKHDLLLFMQSLNENIPFEAPPAKLPASRNKNLDARKVGGTY